MKSYFSVYIPYDLILSHYVQLISHEFLLSGWWFQTIYIYYINHILTINNH